METKASELKKLVSVLENRKADTYGWKKDTNLYFDQIERLVKVETVNSQKRLKLLAQSIIQTLKEERWNYLEKGKTIEQDLEDILTTYQKDLRVAQDANKLSASELAEKVAAKELSLAMPEEPPNFSLPVPKVDMSDFVNKLNEAMVGIEAIKPKKCMKISEDPPMEKLSFSDPLVLLEEGSTHEVFVHSQWGAGTGKFAVRLQDPRIEEALCRFSMHTRINNFQSSNTSYQDMNKEPAIGDKVLITYHNSWYRATVVDLKAEKKLCRVQVMDYGNLESRHFSEVWPHTQKLGKDEPYQMVECTLLEDLSDPKHSRFTDARWTFNRLVQKYMQDSAGKGTFMAKFRQKIENDDSTVWLVDLEITVDGKEVDLSQMVRDKIVKDGQKSAISCHDIRYSKDEIKTTFVRTKSPEREENKQTETPDPVPTNETPAQEELPSVQENEAPLQEQKPQASDQAETQQEPSDEQENKVDQEEKSVQNEVPTDVPGVVPTVQDGVAENEDPVAEKQELTQKQDADASANNVELNSVEQQPQEVTNQEKQEELINNEPEQTDAVNKEPEQKDLVDAEEEEEKEVVAENGEDCEVVDEEAAVDDKRVVVDESKVEMAEEEVKPPGAPIPPLMDIQIPARKQQSEVDEKQEAKEQQSSGDLRKLVIERTSTPPNSSPTRPGTKSPGSRSPVKGAGAGDGTPPRVGNQCSPIWKQSLGEICGFKADRKPRNVEEKKGDVRKYFPDNYGKK